MSEYLFVEKPFLSQLLALGWEVAEQASGIPTDPTLSHRTSFRECVLRAEFRQSVRRLNRTTDGREWLTDTQLDELLDELTGQPGASLLEANEEILKRLFKTTVDRNELTGEESPEVKLIDWQDWSQNRFLAVNQFRIDTPGQVRPFIIPDIVLFVNGLPLVVVECKDATPVAANPLHECFEQLMRYSDQREETKRAGLREGEPRLFHFNQLLIRTSGDRADFGTITSTQEEYFFPWRAIYPERYRTYTPPLGKERAQEILIQGVLAPEILLDIIRHCTIFMEKDGGTWVKIACRYQQYRAVTKIVERLRAEKTPTARSGVIWHTQGSGKSLTMVFLIRKLRTCDDLKDYKVVIVNDRTDLEEQLGETASLTGEKVRYIESADELKTKLATPSSSLNMVMVHKFRVASDRGTPGYLTGALGRVPVYVKFGVVNPSERILVLIDEAHRTQGGSPEGSFSDNLFEAFPNATRLAFTGTPLITDRHSKKTVERFGAYIDKYKLQDAVNDGATVQILYEGRTADTALQDKHEFDTKYDDFVARHLAGQMNKEQNVELVRRRAHRDRRVFEDLFEELTDEQTLELKKKYGTDGDVLEAKERIKQISEDLVEHYVENILPNGFKAQVVCSSKMAAIHYRTHIDNALAERLKLETGKPVWTTDSGGPSESERGDYQDGELLGRLSCAKAAVILSSEGTNEKAVITEARKASKEAKAVDNFKKKIDPAIPETGIVFLVVCDMLLTGFDAPIEQVMYIDKRVREHNLLQTIARVNRVAKGKSRGYIVDYIGLARRLKEALLIYSESDQQDVKDSLKDISSEIPVLESRFQRLLQLFTAGGVPDIEPFVRQTISDPKRSFEVLERSVDLLEDIKLRADFEIYLKKFFQSMDIILPNTAAAPYKIPARRFGYLHSRVRERYKDESLDISGVGEKVRKLVNEHLIGLGINPKIPPVELFSPDFVTEVEKNVSAKAKASEMEHAIRKHLKVHFEEDPALYQKLSDKLESLIQRYRQEWDQLYLDLKGLRAEAVAGRKEEVTGLAPKESPFYDLVGQVAFGGGVPDEHAVVIKATVKEMVGLFRRTIGIVNFWSNGFEVDKLKGALSDLLLLTGIDAIIDNCDRIVTEVTALAKVRHQDVMA